MIKEYLRLPQISSLAGVKRHTLNARIKTMFIDDDLLRSSGNHIILRPNQVRKIINKEIINKPNRTIFVGNLKGGVGKTTLAYMLAQVLPKFGLKVCAIDLDVQANLTNQFMHIATDQPVFFDLIDGKIDIKDLPVKISDNFDLIPSSLKNSLIQKSLTIQTPKHHLTWFNDLCLSYLRATYDVIIVDTPPNLSTLNSVFCLCLEEQDSILVPVAPEEFSIMGVKMFLDDVNDIRRSYKIDENINIKILMNRFFQTQKSNLEILVKMSELYGDLFSNAILRDFSKVREMMNKKQDISEVKSGKEIYEFIQGLLVDLNILQAGGTHGS